MGNCLVSNKVVSQNGQELESETIEQIKRPSMPSELEPIKHVKDGRKKVVRFKLCEEGNNVDKDVQSRGGAVRIRMVVTREELRHILSSHGKDLKGSSVEQLASALKLRGRRITHEARTSDGNIWKPALESISEDH